MSETGGDQQPGDGNDIPSFLFKDFFGDIGYRAVFLPKIGFVGDTGEIISTSQVLIEDYESGDRLFYKELNLSAMLSLLQFFSNAVEESLIHIENIGIKTLSLPLLDAQLTALEAQSVQISRIRDLLLRTTENYRKKDEGAKA